MSKDEGWTFEAWRKCMACDGDGLRKDPVPPGLTVAGQSSYVAQQRSSECPACNGDDKFKRKGYQRKTFTLAQLADALGALKESTGDDE